MQTGELRVVVLEYPTHILSEATPQALLSNLLALRVRGYGKEYPEGVLPLDTYDFIGTHLMVCREENGRLVPISGFRSVFLSTCDFHRLPFPALELIRTAGGATSHEWAVRKILKSCRDEGVSISYESSWTIQPEVRKDRELTNYIRDMLTAVMALHQRDAKVTQSLVCGVLRFKTDQFFKGMGFIPLDFMGSTLPELHQASLFGETVVMMHRKKVSEHALMLSEKFESHWANRICFGPSQADSEIVPLKKAA